MSVKRPINSGKFNESALEERFGIADIHSGPAQQGYLFNYKETELGNEDDDIITTGLKLYFVRRDGTSFRSLFEYKDYFYIELAAETRPEIYTELLDILAKEFESFNCELFVHKKLDCSRPEHIDGTTRDFIKMIFGRSSDMRKVSFEISRLARQNNIKFNVQGKQKEHLKIRSHELQNSFDLNQTRTTPLDYITGLREHDVAYTQRVSIDNEIFCGKWYEVTFRESICIPVALDSMVKIPPLRVLAYDIEVTKDPLKFPDAEKDEVMMISVMLDHHGYLLVNREIVVADIQNFEYSPKPEYRGVFQVINYETEMDLIKGFFTLIIKSRPHIIVTYNGDSFDFPFVKQRADKYKISMEKQIGITSNARHPEDTGDHVYFSGRWILHLDAFGWVKRDSYLPMGSRSLKAVTRVKLKYDPVELDPELMTPFAMTKPDTLAAYSVSDAVATYYLYKKYVHDFIQALSSIIPYGPDDILRKGSGTLCEALLMTEAFRVNIIFPNKVNDVRNQTHEGLLLDSSTYEGGRVECLATGVFRADIPENFRVNPKAIQGFMENVDQTLDFFLTVENSVDKSKIKNYDQVREGILEKLGALKECSQFTEEPSIIHLDVAAMYPNIILTNRLQPTSVVTEETCIHCPYNEEANKCKRKLPWKWRGDIYTASKGDLHTILRELQNTDALVHEVIDYQTGKKVKKAWKDLTDAEQNMIFITRVKLLCQRMYAKVKTTKTQMKESICCQRENSFYVDTVKAFRDRRYKYKKLNKQWINTAADKEEAGDALGLAEARDMCLLYDSLQLAHKCILNSFYGYVMRKGARWMSMEMAGIVTYLGSTIISETRDFVAAVGTPLELDTDGIWCLLPKSFPYMFKFELEDGSALKLEYPCTIMNQRVAEKFTNHQYQDLVSGEWKTSSTCSIEFEIDGPYRAMMIPAATEESKMPKKRYAIFDFDGSITELKGFEIKRRGELRLVQMFQEKAFPLFLAGSSRQDIYSEIGRVANYFLDIIDSNGKTTTDEELIHLLCEKKSISKTAYEMSANKSVPITVAFRLAQLNGNTVLHTKGLQVHLVMLKYPADLKVSERPVPVSIFKEEQSVKHKYLKEWCCMPELKVFDIRDLLDWDYYRQRLIKSIQKILSIPSANQKISNPCPRAEVPKWYLKRLSDERNAATQLKLDQFLVPRQPRDIEDLVAAEPDDQTDGGSQDSEDDDCEENIPFDWSTAGVQSLVNRWRRHNLFSSIKDVEASPNLTISTEKSNVFHILEVIFNPSGLSILWVLCDQVVMEYLVEFSRYLYPVGPDGQLTFGDPLTVEHSLFQRQKLNGKQGGRLHGLPLEDDFLMRLGAVVDFKRPKNIYTKITDAMLNASPRPYLQDQDLHVLFFFYVRLHKRSFALIYLPNRALTILYQGSKLRPNKENVANLVAEMKVNNQETLTTFVDPAISVIPVSRNLDFGSAVDVQLQEVTSLQKSLIIAVSSSLSHDEVASHVHSLQRFPKMRMCPLKNEIIRATMQSEDPQWVPNLIYQTVTRIPELENWFVERCQLARLAGAPLGNLPGEWDQSCARVLNASLTRKLHQKNLLISTLKVPSSQHPEFYESLVPHVFGLKDRTNREFLENLFPEYTEIQTPGVYRSFCLCYDFKSELILTALSRVTGLNKGEDVSSEVLKVIEDFTRDLWNQARDHPDLGMAAKLARSLDSWLVAQQTTELFGTNLVNPLRVAVRKALKLLLADMEARLGFTVVFADFNRMILCTNKVSWSTAEFQQNQLRLYLAEHPLFKEMQPELTQVLAGLVWQNSNQYACHPFNPSAGNLETPRTQIPRFNCLPTVLYDELVKTCTKFIDAPVHFLAQLPTKDKSNQALVDQKFQAYMQTSFVPEFSHDLLEFLGNFCRNTLIPAKKKDNEWKDHFLPVFHEKLQDFSEKDVEICGKRIRGRENPVILGLLHFLTNLLDICGLDAQFDRRHIESLVQSSIGILELDEFSGDHKRFYLRNLLCQKCLKMSDIDLATHSYGYSPDGLPTCVCPFCETGFDRLLIEERLLHILWDLQRLHQTQFMRCAKCGRVKKVNFDTWEVSSVCICFGTYQCTVNADDEEYILGMLNELSRFGKFTILREEICRV